LTTGVTDIPLWMRSTVDLDLDRLSRTDVGQLRFLEIGNDPDLARDDGHEVASITDAATTHGLVGMLVL